MKRRIQDGDERNKDSRAFSVYETYSICALSGTYDSFQTFTEPLWEELLPPPLPPPHQKPYTLLVSLDDLLITSTWDVSTRVTLLPPATNLEYVSSVSTVGEQQSDLVSITLLPICPSSTKLSCSLLNIITYVSRCSVYTSSDPSTADCNANRREA